MRKLVLSTMMAAALTSGIYAQEIKDREGESTGPHRQRR